MSLAAFKSLKRLYKPLETCGNGNSYCSWGGMNMILKASLILFLAAFPGAFSWAEDSSQEVVELVYDPTKLTETSFNGAELSERLENEIKNPLPANNKEYEVPLAPSSEEDLKAYRELNKADGEEFLQKKHQFFHVFSQRLQKMKVPKILHNAFLKYCNTRFFIGAPVISKSNAMGVQARIQVSGGAGFRDVWLKTLRSSKLGAKLIPEAGGVFLAFGFGVGIVKVKSSKVSYWSLDVFTDFSTLKNVGTWIGMVTLDAGPNFFAEVREGGADLPRLFEKVPLKRLTFKMDPVGGLFSNEKTFGYGVTLPLPNPVAPVAFTAFTAFTEHFMVYELNLRRLTWMRLNWGGHHLCSGVFL